MCDSFCLLNYKYMKGKKPLGIFYEPLYLTHYLQFLLSWKDLVSIA